MEFLVPTQYLVPAGADDGKYVHKDVDDVQIKGECTENIFLWTDGIFVLAAHHHLRVVCGREMV